MSKIAVLGARGMVGNAIVQSLQKKDYSNILMPTSTNLNLCDQNQTNEWFNANKPEYVYLSAAKVGGIQFNIKKPVEFGEENMRIILNVFNAAHRNNVKKLLFLGSSCIYPKNCPQPMKEEYFMSGPFEPTNEMYAFAKAFGIRLCSAYRKEYGCNFIACQPCNIYGIKDNFDPDNSHVVAALIRKFYLAKKNNENEVLCWGDGSARREILFSSDIGDACVFLMDNYNDDQFINVGYGTDLTIKELTEKISKLVGYSGKIVWDVDKPSGMKQKLVDVTRIKQLGWSPIYDIDTGLKMTYEWFISNVGKNL